MYLRSFALVMLLAGCADPVTICKKAEAKIDFYEGCQESRACNMTPRERRTLIEARVTKLRWCDR